MSQNQNKGSTCSRMNSKRRILVHEALSIHTGKKTNNRPALFSMVGQRAWNRWFYCGWCGHQHVCKNELHLRFDLMQHQRDGSGRRDCKQASGVHDICKLQAEHIEEARCIRYMAPEPSFGRPLFTQTQETVQAKDQVQRCEANKSAKQESLQAEVFAGPALPFQRQRNSFCTFKEFCRSLNLLKQYVGSPFTQYEVLPK